MYKILSLDGGGSWAIIQLLTLKERFKNQIPGLKGHDILRQFDLVISNSGGSIILAALAANLTIDEAIELFNAKENRVRLFSRNSYKETYFPTWFIRKFIGPKYSAERKLEALNEFFVQIKDTTMSELSTKISKDKDLRITVVAYDALNNRAKFFRTHEDSKAPERKVRFLEAVHASSNPPIQYFDFPARIEAPPYAYELWDGALGGFNNPVAAGVIEALKAGISRKDIYVVSLGNSNSIVSQADKEYYALLKNESKETRRNKWRLSKYGLQVKFFVKTVKDQAKTILYDPPDWSNYVAMMLLKDNMDEPLEGRFIRLSPLIHVDGSSDRTIQELLKKLYALDFDLTKEPDVKLVRDCFEQWKANKIKNHPVDYSISADNQIKYKFGDSEFKDGMAKWMSIP